MLSQLLRKHGLNARIVPHSAVSRSNLPDLDVTGVAMVCISYLEITGTPAHLRYLIRRLRQKTPSARILVGLWPAGEAVLTDERLRTAIGADDYATSLRDVVAAALSAARQAGKTEALSHTDAPEQEPPSRRERATATAAV